MSADPIITDPVAPNCALVRPPLVPTDPVPPPGVRGPSPILTGPTSTGTPPALTLPFDFAVIRYQWTSADGRDLDTRTAVSNPSRLNDVGWHRNITDPTTGILPACQFSPAPSDTSPYYLVHGGDNCVDGVEAVLVDFAKLVADFPLQTSFSIRLRAYWYNFGYDPTAVPPRDGRITAQFQTYLGGTMTHVGYDFVNVGGTVRETISVPVQLYTNTVGADVDGDEAGTLVYNPSTKQATIIPAVPGNPPPSNAVNSRTSLMVRSVATKS